MSPPVSDGHDKGRPHRGIAATLDPSRPGRAIGSWQSGPAIGVTAEAAGYAPREIATFRKLTRGLLTVLHWLAHVTHGALVLTIVLLAGSAWRLAQGPVDISWFTARLEAALNTPDSLARLHIGHTALAWEGFRLGVGRPIDLRLTGVRLTDQGGRPLLAVPQAELSLSLAALLRGRLQPSAIELDRPRLRFRRAANGTLSLDLGDLTNHSAHGTGRRWHDLLAELARPPVGDRSEPRDWVSQIRRVRIRDASVTVQDLRNGVTWRAPHVDIDLTRNPAGGMRGSADLALALKSQHARLHATGTLSATGIQLSAALSPIVPAALARVAPGLEPLAPLDLPVAVAAALRLGPDLNVRHFRLNLQAGAGTVQIRQTIEPIVAARLALDGAPDAARIDEAQVELRGHPGAELTTLDASGTLRRDAGKIGATLSLGLDHVDFADLPRLWPEGVAVGARAWVIRNITAGVARDGHVRVTLAANQDVSDVELTQASGTLDGSGLTVHWLRPVPPITNGRGQLHILGPDTLEIDVRNGRQLLPNSRSGLTVDGGSMRVTGIMEPHQIGTIEAKVSGSLPDALALLRQPRLRLLARHPLPLANPAGKVAATLFVRLPMEKAVTMDQIAIRAAATLDDVHLDGLAAGLPLNGGTLDLHANNDGLTLKGQAKLAGIPAKLDAAMDFRAGGPNEVLQKISVVASPDAKQLTAVGLDASGLLSGPVPLQAVLTEQRNGMGALSVQADLTPATFSVEPLAWRKPPGAPASASVRLRLARGRLNGIDRFTVSGNGLSVQGSADCTDGKVSLVRLDRVVLGHSDLHGTVRLPATQASPIVVSLSGPQLDLSARLARKRKPIQRPVKQPPPGSPWTLDARIGRVLMAHGLALTNVTVQANNDGRKYRRLQVAGEIRPHAPFSLRITPEAGDKRQLAANAADTGDLLRALDWTDTMQGGQLHVTGTYDDMQPGDPLSGTANLTNFRVKEAVGLGKLLQAMTLYGLVDALHGPGLAFNRAVVPFRLASGMLELSGARAFSSSLGLTAKGRIDLDAERVNLQGTIVPAYFFNSLLGHLPLVGKLLSPERGGGVFAANYTLRGNLNDPDVTVNPLSALTPGFLRGLFGIF